MTIRLPLKKLSHWQQITFAAALLERMLPNYQMFADAFDFGDAKLLRNQLNLVWQWLDKSQKIKVNTTAQLEKLAQVIPDPEAFDSFGVYPAIDASMAVTALLQAISERELEYVESVSRLSANSVNYYVELILIDELGPEQEIDQLQINAHPLMVWERETQNELFDFLQNSAENKQTLQRAKAMVLEEGLSNLGIEI
ncbi:YjaG family protein [Endozoicomonas sp. G2_1]|uniref:YjaG family protein n=1 Tax=Endozoicomonas sp. G2_1 TaxID=2821091 RepID=UPI001ADA13CD|nr:YjaG family protein [Endozoicomonas sp. G2_1]